MGRTVLQTVRTAGRFAKPSYGTQQISCGEPLGLSKEMAGPVVGPAAPGAAGRRSPDRTMPRSAAPRDGRPSFREGATRVPLGAIWVPQGATPVAPMMRKGVALWRSLQRLALGKLVVVK